MTDSTGWFQQVNKSSMILWRDRGATHAVAVKQDRAGSSEDHSNRMLIAANVYGRGLCAAWPGGDSWDNPCICVVWFADGAAAEEVHKHFPRSQIINLSDTIAQREVQPESVDRAEAKVAEFHAEKARMQKQNGAAV